MFGFPLLLLPLAIYNIIVFLMPGVSFGASLFTIPLMSGALWPVTLSDSLVALGLLLLLLELLRSTRVGGKFIIDHLLALVIFGAAAVEFLLLPQFASSTFFLLTVIALVDFLAGFGLHARRRRVREPAIAPVPEATVVHEPPPRVVVTPIVPEPPLLPAAPVAPIRPTYPEPSPRIEPIIDIDPVLEDTPAPPKPLAPSN